MKNLKYIIPSKHIKYVLVLLLLIVNSSTLIAQVSPEERQALIDFYTSTNGANWKNTVANNKPWLINDPTSLVSSWYGVTVSNNRVTKLSLSKNNVTGTLPNSIGNLSNLTQLILSSNEIGGTLPTTLGQMTGLRGIHISNNNFSGTLPVVSLKKIPNLSHLYFDRNNFTGNIPTELGQLSNLLYINLGNNQFTGGIPVELTQLSKLSSLYLSNNQLTGNIPTEIGQLTNLGNLGLSGNQLTGVIPESIGSLTKLGRVSLDNNLLTGSIPTTISQLVNVRQVNFSSNQLSGVLPSALGQLTALENLFLNDNQLTGSIPAAIGQLTRLKFLGIRNNQLSGSIPVELGQLSNIENIHLHKNQLTGSIPESFGQLVKLKALYLYTNNLSGKIPTSITTLPSLTNLGISGNKYVFSDFETDFLTIKTNIASFTYNQQKKADIEETLNVVPGGSIILSSNVFTSPNNTYQWYKGNRAIAGATSKEYTITNAKDTDAGIYKLLVRNTVIDKLFIYRNDITLTVTAQDACGVSAIEKQALLDFYTSTGGASWTNSTTGNRPWSSNTPVCDWFGVTVENGKVTKLSLVNNKLKGPIPASFGDLTNLTFVNLAINQLSGELPVSVGNLTNVHTFTVERNAITGTIPVSIGDMVSLRSLNLGSNQLSGTIPPDLQKLTNLTILSLFRNSLTGSIPAELGNLINLEALNLFSNQLTGTIPASIGGLLKLKKLMLYINRLEGPLPPELGNMQVLEELHLERNVITGAIPIELGNISSLQYANLGNNNLSGSIPKELGNLLNLKGLYLFWNQLEGVLPAEIGNLINLEVLSLTRNRLSGSIPVSIGQLPRLKNVGMGINKFSGNIPSGFSTLASSKILTSFSFENNDFIFSNFEQEFPAYQSNLTTFSFQPQAKVDLTETQSVIVNNTIVLTSQELTSTNNSYQWYKDGVLIPGATSKELVIANAKETDAGVYHFTATNTIITGLTLTRNPITLTVNPVGSCVVSEAEKQALIDLYNTTNGTNWTHRTNWLTNAPVCDWYGVTVTNGKVTELTLISNNLVGEIPSSIRGLTHLIKLDLGTNQLTGTIPSTINQLRNLEFLSLNQNDLYGEIPISIADINTLRSLYLGHNKLTGTIPDLIAQLKELRYLHLQGNKLTGTIPAVLSTLSNLTDLNLYSNELTGAIPSELGQLNNLKTLHLDNNQLTGEIPVSFGGLSSLVDLNLYNNILTGSIPAELGQLSALQSLYVYNNQLSGDIPAELGQLVQLKALDIHGNQLSGKLPESFMQLSSLESLWVHDNQFSGTVPAAITTLPNLRLFNMSGNQFVFSDIESEFTAYTLMLGSGFVYIPQAKVDEEETLPVIAGEKIVLGTQELSSINNQYQWYKNNVAIPGATNATLEIAAVSSGDAGIYHFTATNTIVHDLILERHPIEVTISSDPCSVSAREKQALIDFYNLTGGNAWTNTTNWLTDTPVCNWYGVTVEKGKVTGVNLAVNNLTGNIPDVISNLTYLRQLDISGNQLTGEIPVTLKKLTYIEQLLLNTNALTGNLFPEIGQLTKLKTLRVANNQLTGEIPLTFNQLIGIEIIDLSNNMLSGGIPSGMNQLLGLQNIDISGNQYIFSGLEPEFVALQAQLGAGFIYAPQAKVDEASTRSVAIGETITLTTNTLTSIHNSYQWYKDDVIIVGATTKEYVIPTATASDAGLYHFTATNSIVTGLTLTRYPIQVEVGTSSCEISAEERQALIDFYQATNGANWANTIANDKPWKINDPTSKVCDWYGVTVRNGRVSGIRLENNQVIGTFPPSIFKLKALEEIWLMSNQLSGILPDEIINLRELQVLNLNNNNLERDIVADIGTLPNLKRLFLSNNNFTGNIPSTLGQVTNLEILGLDSNQLSGILPAGLEQLVNLTGVTIFDNQFIFSGIEPEFDRLKTKLGTGFIYAPQAKVDDVVSKTAVTGIRLILTSDVLSSPNNTYQWYKDNVAIPGATGKELVINSVSASDAGVYHFEATNTVVTGLTLLRNPITISVEPADSCGVSPEEKQALIDFYQATNGVNWTNRTHWLSPTVPVCDWYGVTVINGKIIELSLPKNNVSGTIPAAISGLQYLTRLRLDDNKLSGNIPTAIGELSNLQEIQFSWNHLTGEIPSVLGGLMNLRVLEAMGNQLTGEIPSALGTLTNLERLSLYRNLLRGTIPVELGNLSKLKYLSLSDNQLSGSIPVTLGNLMQLRELSLFRNQLSETIPTQLGQLSNLQHLYLNHNQLSGSIPDTFRNLTNLQFLWLSDNQLSHTIPGTLGSLRKLQDFKANNNLLSGIIPQELGNVISLKYLELANNQLSGPIPSSFGSLTHLQQLYLSNNQLSGRVPPALSQLASLKHLMIDSNKFVFWNVEPEFTAYQTKLTSFLYIPQAKVDKREYHSIYVGKDITFSSEALISANNSYQWYKNGVAIAGATNKDLIITNATAADAGDYYFTATNSIVTDLILTRHTITLAVIVPNWDTVQSFCSSEKTPTVSDLVSPIVNTPVVSWYTTQTGGVALPGTTLLDPVVYWAEGNTANPRVGVKVNLNEGAPGNEETEGYQEFSIISNSKIKDLQITGTSITWYSTPTAGTPLDVNALLEDGKSYYAQQGTASCRFEVVVAIKVQDPEGDGWQYFCKSVNATVADLSARYTLLPNHTLLWYKGATGAETYALTEGLTDGGIYYAVQRDPLQNESARRKVVVSIFDVPPPVVTNTRQTFYTNETATVSDLIAVGNNIIWYDAAFGGTAYNPTEHLVHGQTYYAAQTTINCNPEDIGCCVSSFREAVTVSILDEVPPSLIGCERFRPQPGAHYVISAWVREDGLKAIDPVTKNFSEVSDVFVKLLNHLKDKVIEGSHIPQKYIPNPESREFDVLIPFIKNAVDKNLTVYDFTYVKGSQHEDNLGRPIGPVRTIGFKFSLTPGNEQYPQFLYRTPLIRSYADEEHRYPLRHNPTLVLNFTDASVCGTNFCMTSSFKIDGGDLSYNRTNIVDRGIVSSAIVPSITTYTYIPDPAYQVMDYANSLLRLRYRNQDGVDIVPPDNAAIEFMPKGAIVDGWQRITADFTIPVDAVNMQIHLESRIQGNSTEQLNVYFDDIRMHPFEGNMKTFVYDPITQRLKSELDENNYATFYEYDQEGGLIRVKKETERGVFTIQETRSGNIKRNH